MAARGAAVEAVLTSRHSTSPTATSAEQSPELQKLMPPGHLRVIVLAYRELALSPQTSWGAPEILRTCRQILILTCVVNHFSGGISCQQPGSRRGLATIVKGSTERAKMRKTCSSQSSKPYVQTYQHLPRMMPRQLSINLAGSRVSSRSRRWCR
jgi:hypothetical protein